MRPDVFETIKKHYQNHTPMTRAAYYGTPEYKLLVEKRVAAEKHHPRWNTFRRKTAGAFPELAANDFTHLGKDAGFFLELYCHPGIPYCSDDREMMDLAGGKLRRMNILVSAIGPFFFRYVFEMEWADGDKDSLRFTSIFNDDFSELERKIAGHVDDFWIPKGYELLGIDDVLEEVPGYFDDVYYYGSAEQPGNVYLFLFTSGDWVHREPIVR